MVMRVDEAWQDDVPARVEHAMRPGRRGAQGDELDDAAAIDHDSAGRLGQDRERLADPERSGIRHGRR